MKIPKGEFLIQQDAHPRSRQLLRRTKAGPPRFRKFSLRP